MVYTLKLIKVFILQYTEAEAYMESSIGEVMGNITHFFNIKKKEWTIGVRYWSGSVTWQGKEVSDGEEAKLVYLA